MGCLTLESADQASDRTAIACEVNVVDRALASRSKMKIWPVSRASATLRPSGDWRSSGLDMVFT